MTSSTSPAPATFAELGLPQPLLQSLIELGYETPSPIQAASIPILLAGRDLLGQAQTGTGKTAAFALPMLTNLDPQLKHPQLLVLAPTRELAIQVAEAFQRYSRNMGFTVLPIYGGQSYSNQLRQLKHGTQIIVGTPGRVMDHIRRGTLMLDKLQALVLDEADEMLRMGFIDDVEWILEHIPKKRQIALFSATMPKEIQKVANTYLNDPETVKIVNKTSTASTIRQRYSLVNNNQKLAAFARVLEVEDFEGVIVFVRTKLATVEVADKLAARGYRCQALNGDVPQNQREQIVEKMKRGNLDILVATDVAARGLDIDRISHVVNFDIPLDTESYVHRIGRTGRAGRSGEAILFVTPRERRLLGAIERATKSPMEAMDIPSADDVTKKRAENFKQQITDTIAHKDLNIFRQLVTEYRQEHDNDPETIAAALAYLIHGEQFAAENDAEFKVNTHNDRQERGPRSRDERGNKPAHRGKDRERGNHREGGDRERAPKRAKHSSSEDMESYRIEVGRNHGVKPGNIVGAIANEADINSQHIGHIKINDEYSTVDLPKGMPKAAFKKLQKAYVCGKPMSITPLK
jgi:ATP-dependent RNA helicase DeaD